MTNISRRRFGQIAGGFGAASLSGINTFAIAQTSAKIVIVGGGAGGASVATALKKEAPNLDVTLIEANPVYATSFFSNLAVGGFRSFESLNHTYDGVKKLGVKVVIDFATAVDPAKKTVRTRGGRTFAYDRLVLSPGIDIKYDSVPGYSREISNTIPHAYQTSALGKRQLMSALAAVPAGGTFAMVMPADPYRCPPGPYERACMIAHYLKTKKPKARLVILDPKKAFSKQPVFTEAFEKYYKDIVELNLSNDIDDFSITALDAKGKTLTTKAGKKVKFDQASIIPQQRAGAIAEVVREGDWCPIKGDNFLSTKDANIHVIGDASVAAPMPKSAFSANSQAKSVASAILAAYAKKDAFPARYRNTCWSLVAADDCVKVGANYAMADGKLAASGSFVSQKGEDAGVRKQNYAEAIGWYDAITADMFAKAPKAAPAASGKKG